MTVFAPLGDSDHVVVSVFNDSLSNPNWNAPFAMRSFFILVLIGMVFVVFWKIFHCRIYLIKKLWIGYGWDWCMYPHRKYQVKPHWCPWFSAICAIVMVHINYFFPFSKKDKNLLCLRQSSDRRIIVRKEFLKLSDLLMLAKQESITYKKPGSCTFLTIANSVL